MEINSDAEKYISLDSTITPLFTTSLIHYYSYTAMVYKALYYSVINSYLLYSTK